MKKCLLVIDFQNDFVDGTLGFEDASNVEKPIVDRIKEFKEQGHDVIFTRDTHDENYLNTQEGRKLPIEHCIKGTHGWQIYGEAKKYADEGVIFDKIAFGSLELGEYCKEKGYDEIELAGLVSNICIISNAAILKAALPEVRIVVDERMTDSFDKKLHEEALNVMEGFQVDVIRKD